MTGYGVINAAAALRGAASLTPESAALPVGKEGAGGHFGPGDDGTPQKVSVGLDPEYFLIAAVIGGTGLLMVVGGVFLFLSGRRHQRRWMPGPPRPMPPRSY